MLEHPGRWRTAGFCSSINCRQSRHICASRSGAGCRTSAPSRSRTPCTLRQCARVLDHIGVIGVARAIKQRPHLLVGKAVDQAGIAGWIAKGLPTHRTVGATPGKWVTRERPKIDRIACPWLIRRFIDPLAEFIYVPTKDVLDVAKATGGTPYDIEGVEFAHEGERCSFDTIVRIYGIKDAPLDHLAKIVRGADTSRHDLTPQCGGLFAISLGLSANFPNDHDMLEHGMVMYDALYTWCRSLQAETHNWPATAVQQARHG
jgi:hypothetical protein